jgi:hypothetical protein
MAARIPNGRYDSLFGPQTLCFSSLLFHTPCRYTASSLKVLSAGMAWLSAAVTDWLAGACSMRSGTSGEASDHDDPRGSPSGARQELNNSAQLPPLAPLRNPPRQPVDQ